MIANSARKTAALVEFETEVGVSLSNGWQEALTTCLAKKSELTGEEPY